MHCFVLKKVFLESRAQFTRVQKLPTHATAAESVPDRSKSIEHKNHVKKFLFAILWFYNLFGIFLMLSTARHP